MQTMEGPLAGDPTVCSLVLLLTAHFSVMAGRSRDELCCSFL